MTALRIIFSIPLWAVMTALYVLLIIVGWVLIPLAVLFRAYEEKIRLPEPGAYVHIHRFTWPFMWLWDNWEDGIAAGRQYKDCGPVWRQIIYWSALRNPVNNLRIMPYLSCKINPAKVKWRGGPHTVSLSYDKKPPSVEWFFAWQSLIYTNYYRQFYLKNKMYRFWVGWKIFPADEYGISETSYRKPGAGFAIQLKRIL